MKPVKGEADSFSPYLETMKGWTAQRSVPAATPALINLIPVTEPKAVADLMAESQMPLLEFTKELSGLADAGLVTMEQTPDQGQVARLTDAGRQAQSST